VTAQPSQLAITPEPICTGGPENVARWTDADGVGRSLCCCNGHTAARELEARLKCEPLVAELAKAPWFESHRRAA
jgi:hypothetical protein